MNSRELSGRTLDAAVAMHLFGLEVGARENTRTHEQDWVYREASGDWVREPFYVAGLAASLNVGAALRRRGWTRREQDLSGPATPTQVTLDHLDGRSVTAEGGTLGEALCRAALGALEF